MRRGRGIAPTACGNVAASRAAGRLAAGSRAMNDVTMSCEDVQQDLLDALADRGGTQPPRSRELTAHLAQCPACRAALADYERMAVAIAPSAGERSVRPDGGWAAF